MSNALLAAELNSKVLDKTGDEVTGRINIPNLYNSSTYKTDTTSAISIGKKGVDESIYVYGSKAVTYEDLRWTTTNPILLLGSNKKGEKFEFGSILTFSNFISFTVPNSGKIRIQWKLTSDYSTDYIIDVKSKILINGSQASGEYTGKNILFTYDANVDSGQTVNLWVTGYNRGQGVLPSLIADLSVYADLSIYNYVVFN